MADNFLQFALAVPLRTRAEETWLIHTLKKLDALTQGTTHKASKKQSPLFQRVLDETWQRIEFDWYLDQPINTPDAVSVLRIQAEESGNPDQVAAILEAFLARFRPTEAIVFSWACTCSKMRPDEFGGGAVAISATGSTFMDALDWARTKAEAVTGDLQFAQVVSS